MILRSDPLLSRKVKPVRHFWVMTARGRECLLRIPQLGSPTAVVICGSSRLSFVERWLSLGPIGEIFIKSLFTSLRQKPRPIPYPSVVKLVAATRPRRSSAWDGGDTECGIVHILIGDSGIPTEVCAFSFSSVEIRRSNGAAPRTFWDLCLSRLGLVLLSGGIHSVVPIEQTSPARRL